MQQAISITSLIKEYDVSRAKKQVVHARVSNELFAEVEKLKKHHRLSWSDIIVAGVRAYVLENGGTLDPKG